MAAHKTITSKDNPLLVRLRRLAQDPGAYRRAGQVWIEGEHLCAAYALTGRAAPQAVLSEQALAQPALRALAERAQEVVVVPAELMAALSPLESPAALGYCLAWPGAGELQPQSATLVLDRVQDAGNVGTLLRSAAAFGFRQVVALKGTAALWSPKVLRAGMGAHFSLDLVEGLDEDQLMATLQVPLLATSPHATQSLHERALPWPCAWALGNEGQGVSAGLLRRAQLNLRIPQPGGEESLNVAAAGAVCLYESARQRLAPPGAS